MMAIDFGGLAGAGFNTPSTEGYNFEGLGNYDYTGVDSLSNSYDFGSMDFSNPDTGGYTGSLYGDPMGPMASSAMPQDDSFFNSKFGKFAISALRGLANTTPVGRVANIAYDMYKGKDPVSIALGQVKGPAGAALSLGYNAAQGRNVGPQAGGTLGSMFGGQVGGPVGSFLGGQAGAYIGNEISKGGPGPGQGFAQENNGGPDFGNMAGGLAQLYAATQANKGLSGAGANNDAVSGQISQLSSMFGPNSAYAQQLRQTLERKDAAAGRRSQYGPREVQLQAMLADKAAGVADTIGRLSTSNQSNRLAMANQKNQTRAQQLAMLMNLGKSSGAFQGLQDMWNDSRGATPYADKYGYGSEPLDISTPMGGNVLSNPGYFEPTEWNTTWE